MSDKPTLWTADITSWRGISLGAIHWYVKLRSHRCTVDVEWALNEQRAAQMTTRERGSFTWRLGDYTNRFDTKDEAERAAVLAWSWLDAKGAGVLLDRQSSSSSPGKPLAGDAELVRIAQDFHDRADACGWYEGDERTMRVVGNEWWAWELATFDQRESGLVTFRLDERFLITGPLDHPTAVWCSLSGEPEPDQGFEEVHGNLAAPSDLSRGK